MSVTRPASDRSLAQTSHLFRTLRSTEFPWTAERIYLDNASIGPLPERTRRVLDEFTARRTAPYLIDERDIGLLMADTHRTIARLINAEPEEIGLAVNTSFGLNLAAAGLPLEPGETVVVSDREFPANIYPWLQLRRRGIHVELVPTTGEGWPDEDAILQRLFDPGAPRRDAQRLIDKAQLRGGLKGIDIGSGREHRPETTLWHGAGLLIARIHDDDVDVVSGYPDRGLIALYKRRYRDYRQPAIAARRPGSLRGLCNRRRIPEIDIAVAIGVGRVDEGQGDRRQRVDDILAVSASKLCRTAGCDWRAAAMARIEKRTGAGAAAHLPLAAGLCLERVCHLALR